MNRKPSLLIIFLSVFIDLIGFGIVLPLLPSYLEKHGANGLWIGVGVASYSAMQFLFAPAWGRLSDRIGRRPVLLVSNAGAALSYLLFGIGSLMMGPGGLAVLFLSRIFAGICGANLSVASAYIADISPPEKRSAKMALIGIAFGLGFIFGPVLGGLSKKFFGPAGPGMVAASFCAFNAILGYFILGESRQPNSDPAKPRPRVTQWFYHLRRPTVGVLIGIFFLTTFCFTCFETTFTLLMMKRMKLDDYQVAFMFTYCGVLSALIQGKMIAGLVNRFGERRLIFASLLILAVSLGLIPYVNMVGVFITLGIFAIGSSINRGPVFGLISLSTSPDQQGEVMGVTQSVGSLARIVGPIFATIFYGTNQEWVTIPIHRLAMPYVICSGIALIASFLTYWYLCRNHQHRQPVPSPSV